MTDTVSSGGRQVVAPTFVRDYTFKTLQPYFDPYEVVIVHAQGSDPTKVTTSSYGTCESPDGSDMAFLIPVWTSVVYDEYGELVPGGPPPLAPMKSLNTSPSNPLIIGQVAPNPYKLAIPQTGMFAGAGSSYTPYGTFAAYGKQAPGGASKSVVKPRGAVHIGDGMSYDPTYGNMGGAIANGKIITDPNAVDATTNPTPQLGAPIMLHLGKDANAHGVEFWVDTSDKSTKAVGVKLTANSPGLEFDASDGGLKTLGAGGAGGFFAKEGKNIDFTPQIPVDTPVLTNPTPGGTSTTGARDIAYAWIIPDAVGTGTSDSVVSPTAYAVTTDTNNQINGTIPAATITTKATGIKLLAKKTTDPSGPFYEVSSTSPYDPTTVFSFAISADDSSLTTEHAVSVPAINVTDTVALVGLVPDAAHTHTAMGTLGLGTWVSKEENLDWQYHGGNTGSHLFYALDGAEPADLVIAYSRNASGDYNVNDQWNVTADWSQAGFDGHHPQISERMSGLGEFDMGVKTGVVKSAPTDAVLQYPAHWGTLPDGWVLVRSDDNTLWWRSSGTWHSNAASSDYLAGSGITINVARVISVKLCPVSGLTVAAGCLAANPDWTTIIINGADQLQAIGASSTIGTGPPGTQPPTLPPGTVPPTSSTSAPPGDQSITTAPGGVMPKPNTCITPGVYSGDCQGYDCAGNSVVSVPFTFNPFPGQKFNFVPPENPFIDTVLSVCSSTGISLLGSAGFYWGGVSVSATRPTGQAFFLWHFTPGPDIGEVAMGIYTGFTPADDYQTWGWRCYGPDSVNTVTSSNITGPNTASDGFWFGVYYGCSGQAALFQGADPGNMKIVNISDGGSSEPTIAFFFQWPHSSPAILNWGSVDTFQVYSGLPAWLTWIDQNGVTHTGIGTPALSAPPPPSSVPTSPIDYSTYWTAGWNAYFAGTPEVSCPYATDPDANECTYWTQGWIDAYNSYNGGSGTGGTVYSAPVAPTVIPTAETTVWTAGYNDYIFGKAPPYNPYIEPNAATPNFTSAMYWNQGWVDARNAFVGVAGYLMPGGSGGNGAGGTFY